MTNEEAKEAYLHAVELCRKAKHAEALSLLDQVDQARPNSRNVMLQRGLCLARLGQVAEADAALQALEGKLEGERLDELRRAIADAKARAASEAVSHTFVAQDFSEGEAAFLVEAVHPVDLDKTSVTGRVQQGVFRVNEAIVIKHRGSGPVLAPILRIGPADTPLNLLRQGQQGTLLLRVESQHITPGAFLTSSPEQAQSSAATMIQSGADTPMATMLAGADAPEMIEAERRVKSGEYGEARVKLVQLLGRDPRHAAGNRLIARIYLEDAAVRDAAKALEHARAAYNNGGASDGATTDVLAEALAANGDAMQGLRYLERLHTATGDPNARAALSKRIGEYRGKHALGNTWEFADAYGDVIYESGAIEDIVKALSRGVLPKDARCRRDKIGEWRSIEDVLAPEHPEIAALYSTHLARSHPWALYLVIGAAVAAASAFAVVMLGQ